MDIRLTYNFTFSACSAITANVTYTDPQGGLYCSLTQCTYQVQTRVSNTEETKVGSKLSISAGSSVEGGLFSCSVNAEKSEEWTSSTTNESTITYTWTLDPGQSSQVTTVQFFTTCTYTMNMQDFNLYPSDGSDAGMIDENSLCSNIVELSDRLTLGQSGWSEDDLTAYGKFKDDACRSASSPTQLILQIHDETGKPKSVTGCNTAV
ncbi:uncharacterized protein EV422DRAFT_508155 [Fimicolochytrium jonesii]|uniref:uncharacterized protein n=1 Tax=Fimicolochytrium jonesii TaxID=1396493 RepID=UPI0022FED759|nr:uncharacterized protein EV422DRAFT_508155 [Fimicolochytrium jonesii]KAI8818273.1 hypothetical protein EV422DRAFT_508155 [Fimicolochytrium jonesii]